MSGEPEHLACSCGNIVMNGVYLPAGESARISSMDMFKVAGKKLFKISQMGVTVSSYQETSAKVETNTRLVIKCDKCQCSYSLVFSRFSGCEAYIFQNEERVTAKRLSVPNLSIALSLVFPVPLRKFVTKRGDTSSAMKEDRIIPIVASSFHPTGNPFDSIELDPDLEAMFAGKTEIFVGSYKNEWATETPVDSDMCNFDF